MLSLTPTSGSDTITLRIDNMTVAMNMELKDQDMSGQTSGTDSSEQGDKGKTLTFAGMISFKNNDILTTLYQLASAKDNVNQRQVYRIGHDLARELRIREGKFSGTVKATEHSSLLAWEISFTLTEVNGTAGQDENRRQQQSAATQVQNSRQQQALRDAEETLAQ